MITVVASTWSVPAAVRSSATSEGPALLKPSVPLAGTPFGGTAAVGALVAWSGGHLGAHFCTASVVDSPSGDLLITAAHCVNGYADTRPAGLVFVPGYDKGRAPYGIWTVTRIFTDTEWASAADPDHDVAFLAVTRPGRHITIETVTGAESLGIGRPVTAVVRAIGYPDIRDQPIRCQNRVRPLSPTQLEFDCGNYTDGTSGGPLLTSVDPATGDGTVIGIIGGYQQGGGTPDVSYSAVFGQDVRELYATAASEP
ncbi:MAG: serine protease [Streptosporangiaceae bacterium]